MFSYLTRLIGSIFLMLSSIITPVHQKPVDATTTVSTVIATTTDTTTITAAVETPKMKTQIKAPVSVQPVPPSVVTPVITPAPVPAVLPPSTPIQTTNSVPANINQPTGDQALLNSVIASCTSQIDAVEQQLITAKEQYDADSNVPIGSTPYAVRVGEMQDTLSKDNQAIQQIEDQGDEIQLKCQEEQQELQN